MYKVIYGILISIVMIAFCFFLYCCYGLYRVRECRAIDFNSKSCEKWRNY